MNENYLKNASALIRTRLSAGTEAERLMSIRDFGEYVGTLQDTRMTEYSRELIYLLLYSMLEDMITREEFSKLLLLTRRLVNVWVKSLSGPRYFENPIFMMKAVLSGLIKKYGPNFYNERLLVVAQSLLKLSVPQVGEQIREMNTSPGRRKSFGAVAAVVVVAGEESSPLPPCKRARAATTPSQ
jgi:hypothetical protein